ncbi:hypothetical protein ACWCQQ_44270 [Streptomyces sp. NPDC002143]
MCQAQGAAELDRREGRRHPFAILSCILLGVGVVGVRVVVEFDRAGVVGDEQPLVGAEEIIEVVPEPAEPSRDGAHQREAGVPRTPAEQVLRAVVDPPKHLDGLVDDLQHDPLSLVPAEFAVSVDASADLVTEAAVVARIGERAIPAEFPHYWRDVGERRDESAERGARRDTGVAGTGVGRACHVGATRCASRAPAKSLGDAEEGQWAAPPACRIALSTLDGGAAPARSNAAIIAAGTLRQLSVDIDILPRAPPTAYASPSILGTREAPQRE